MPATHILGIDISKDKFDVCLRPAGPTGPIDRACFDNHARGFKALHAWLLQKAVTSLHACLEATSRYGDALALDLYERGHTVSMVNPRRTRHDADSRLVRTQNDAIDAALIADFCATQHPLPWQPMAPERRQLQDLVRTRGFFLNQKLQCAIGWKRPTRSARGICASRSNTSTPRWADWKSRSKPCSRASRSWPAWWSWPTAFLGWGL
jgi:transposase